MTYSGVTSKIYTVTSTVLHILPRTASFKLILLLSLLVVALNVTTLDIKTNNYNIVSTTAVVTAFKIKIKCIREPPALTTTTVHASHDNEQYEKTPEKQNKFVVGGKKVSSTNNFVRRRSGHPPSPPGERASGSTSSSAQQTGKRTCHDALSIRSYKSSGIPSSSPSSFDCWENHKLRTEVVPRSQFGVRTGSNLLSSVDAPSPTPEVSAPFQRCVSIKSSLDRIAPLANSRSLAATSAGGESYSSSSAHYDVMVSRLSSLDVDQGSVVDERSLSPSSKANRHFTVSNVESKMADTVSQRASASSQHELSKRSSSSSTVSIRAEVSLPSYNEEEEDEGEDPKKLYEEESKRSDLEEASSNFLFSDSSIQDALDELNALGSILARGEELKQQVEAVLEQEQAGGVDVGMEPVTNNVLQEELRNDEDLILTPTMPPPQQLSKRKEIEKSNSNMSLSTAQAMSRQSLAFRPPQQPHENMSLSTAQHISRQEHRSPHYKRPPRPPGGKTSLKAPASTEYHLPSALFDDDESHHVVETTAQKDGLRGGLCEQEPIKYNPNIILEALQQMKEVDEIRGILIQLLNTNDACRIRSTLMAKDVNGLTAFDQTTGSLNELLVNTMINCNNLSFDSTHDWNLPFDEQIQLYFYDDDHAQEESFATGPSSPVVEDADSWGIREVPDDDDEDEQVL